jgi:hypothetical protein
MFPDGRWGQQHTQTCCPSKLLRSLIHEYHRWASYITQVHALILSPQYTRQADYITRVHRWDH